MSGAGVSSPRSGSFSCASGGCLSSPPNISAAWAPLGDRKAVNRRRFQSISGFRALNHGSPSTRLQARIGMTSTSGSVTGARCSIYWTVIDVFRLSFACCIICPPKPIVVVCASSCDIPSLLSNLVAIKTLVALQWMRARTRCISPCLSRIWISWIMWAESGVSVPHRYWLNICALGLSRITLDFSAIRWGRISSKVAINACGPTFSNPTSLSSNLPRRAKYRERYASFLLAGCRKIAACWSVGFRCLCRLCRLLEWVCRGKSHGSISGT